jgi:hypothetical protein
MKKVTTILCTMLVASTFAFSQESTFNVGDKVLDLGIGFGSGYYSGSYYHTSVPPISISGEYGVKDGILEKGSIGIGGVIGYSAYKWEYDYAGYNYGWKYTNFMIGVRGSFHYPLVDKLDTYTGLVLGYSIQTESEFGDYVTGSTDNSSAGSRPILGWFVGARYYFNDKFAAFGNLGVGIAYLTLGVSVKL